MTDDELHQLAGAYALDALEPDEAAAFEAHLPACSSCATTVMEFERTAGELGEVGRRQPPASLKARIMADIATTPQLSSAGAERSGVDGTAPTASPSLPAQHVDELARRRRPLMPVVAAFAAALFVVVGVVATFALPDGKSASEELIAAPDAVTLQLEPTEAGPSNITVEVVWSQEQDRALVKANGLADPGEGMDYQLWFVVPDGVAPAGLFSPEDGVVEALLDLDDVEGLGWGISIEPDAGSDQPTSEVLFLGLA